MSSYRFDAAFPDGHFVSDYMEFASRQTDAAYEYHEAVALTLLATATPDVRAHIKQFPNALRTNLYVALVGSTSKSRKSTAKDIGIDLARRVFPTAVIADKSTPEAFAMELADHNRVPALWGIDEFAALLVQMHRRDHLQGLVSLVLELYGKPDHIYKRVKGNVEIRDAHLTIIGCAADTVFDALHTTDVESGLLPRFAIIFPDTKPARMPFAALTAADDEKRNALVRRLAAIAPQQRDSNGRWMGEPRIAEFGQDAFAAIDRFAQQVEERHDGEMFRRLLPMVLKVAILSAMGSASALTFGLDGTRPVAVEDVEAAIKVISRWARFAEVFTQRLGASKVDNLIRRAIAFFESRKAEYAPRRTIARHLHVDNRVFADVEKTMLDRELIAVVVNQGSKQRLWKWLEFNEQEKAA
jgi:hypothetical protein